MLFHPPHVGLLLSPLLHLLLAVHRDTGLFVPLLAAVGVASLVSEYAEGIFSQQFEQALTNIYFRERLLFWGVGDQPAAGAEVAANCLQDPDAAAGGAGGAASAGGGSMAASAGSMPRSTSTITAPAWSVGPLAVKPRPQLTVESVIATPAKLYVRHTLPLEQAKEALAARASAAAVVVDDNFSPMGIVYLEDIEAELVKQQLLNEPDANFDRPRT